MLICALFGMGINMLAFFKGLELSTPINSSVLITTTPLIVVVLSAILIKEQIAKPKILGILIGLIGAIALVLFGSEIRQDAPNIPFGNILFIVNSVSYGLYLILVKKLVEKYHPFTFMKWLFTIGTFICLPIGYSELNAISWETLPFEAIWKIIFVVVGTTFLTYLFNIFALTQLKASTLSAFVYLQPLIGILFAVLTGKDTMTTIKIVGTTLVLLGVYLTSKKPLGGIRSKS